MATYTDIPPVAAGGTTRSATTASAVTTLSIDVSADGDGEYLVEFEGDILASGAVVSLKLQANGADLPSQLGNYTLFSSNSTSITGGLTTTGALVCVGQSFMTNNHMTVLGSLSWRASTRSGWASQFGSHSDGGDFSGITCGTYVAGAAALSTIALTATVANGIPSGTFRVRKVA